MKSISIIIPAYHAEYTIQKSLRSAWRICSLAPEFIIVCEESDTETIKEVQKAVETVPFLYDTSKILIHSGRMYPGNARNMGLEAATGDYIAFLDADDSVSYDLYNDLLQGILCTEPDIAIMNYGGYVGEENWIHLNTADEKRIALSCYGILRRCCWDKVYKKEIVQGLRFAPDVLSNEELPFTIPAYLRATSIWYSGIPSYHYYNNPKGAHTSVKAIHEIMEAWKLTVQQAKDDKTYDPILFDFMGTANDELIRRYSSYAE